jgi:uncharacterized protein YyaL (SSP411 family)
MPNALAHETSPYLLQHAHNPVDWLPWGEGAFARARTEDKLVFLSVGYSTCHWCHVMERESFENPVIAAVMNRHFICVKVDREERPDLDAAYMAFVQAATGQGGWPMSVWLTPDGEPLVGGTYFPPADHYGRPGFPKVCEEIARLWREDRSRLAAGAPDLFAQLQQHGAAAAPATGLAGPAVLEAFLTDCERSFDREWGGFGGAPKFPRPAVLRTLMQLAERFGPRSPRGKTAARMATDTLDRMAAGGIHDHLAGGFHRYSVDRRWHVPHYEKMLYDQAQLIHAYLDGWQLGGADAHRRSAEGICRYLLTDLRDPGGAFHAAEDADSLPAPDAPRKLEGAFWTWTAAELTSLLDDASAALFAAAYGVLPVGNAAPDSDPHGELAGRNTLFRARDDAALAADFGLSEMNVRERLRAAAAILLEQRATRPPPHRDDKIVTAWNGLAIGALARAGRVLERPDLGQAAADAATFLLAHLWDGVTLYRSFRRRRGTVPGFPADYAFLIGGLLELHAYDPQAGWLDRAVALQQRLDATAWDEDRAGYVMRPAVGERTLLVIREDYDGAEPAPNHQAAENLLKLAALLDQPSFLTRAETLLRAGTPTLESHPFAAPLLVAALDLHQRGVMKFQLPLHPAAAALAGLRRTYLPRAAFTAATGDEILLCEGSTCRIYPPA